MSEMAKTAVFVAVAAASLTLGLVFRSGEESFNEEDYVGDRLNQFEVEDPKRLKIVKFDPETATTHEFEVASENGLWTIPSKEGYPADAAKQMAEAATCLIDRQVLKVAATSAGEHRELGVIDPSSSGLGSSDEGVGTRVIMTNSSDDELVDMIIGKPVKDAEGQRFVRNTDQDIVYVVELNPEKLSTQFEEWIEGDLLKLNPMDIREVQINDYSASLQTVLGAGGFQTQVSWDRRAEMDLQYDNNESKWSAASLRSFDAKEQVYTERPIADDEELNDEALSELRTGLDELLLVDVQRKPEGLSSDLKAGGDFLKNKEAIDSLIERGFAPLRAGGEGAGVEILSSEGEVICTLADGVEYVLRFGNLKLGDGVSDESVSDSAEGEKDAGEGIHRFLFVMARFNEAMIEKPELADLPALPEDTEKETADEDSATDELTEKTDAEEASSEEPEADDSSEEETEEAKENEESEESEEGEESAEEDVPDELAKIIAERKLIETENQRRLDEYQSEIEAGKTRVKELNERFGDWYYVISNEVYKKIHLGLDQVIRKKESPENESNPAAGLDLDLSNGLPGLPSLPAGAATSASDVESKPKPEAGDEAETEAEPTVEAEAEVEAEEQATAE